jgi:hypothetical protein
METVNVSPQPVVNEGPFHKIWRTVYNWREIWFWPALALIQWWLLIQLAARWSGRKPQESLDYLTGLGSNILVCVVAISLISILRESSGEWWTKDDLKTYPHLAWTSASVKIVFGLAFLYLLSH